MALRRRAVVVHRRTELEDVVARHGTIQQAEFFLRQRGQDISELIRRDELNQKARAAVDGAIPFDWRRAEIERADLDRFVFGPEDVVIVVGQDGLVANAAKYLDGHPVIGVNPDPSLNPGVLVPHQVNGVDRLMAGFVNGRTGVERRTLVEARTDDGQVLRSLNELYIGHASHQSARYLIEEPGGSTERHSSSGVLVGTGTGCTGWLLSVWRQRRSVMQLPGPGDQLVCWFAREVWPSPSTGTDHVEGLVGPGQALTMVAERDLVCFGDGVEADRISLSWGQRIEVYPSDRSLSLVTAVNDI